MQIPEHIRTDTGDAIHPDVRQRFMPANIIINLGTQAGGASRGVSGGFGVSDRVPTEEIGPNHHRFALTEVIAVDNGLFFGFATIGADVGKGT
ncbi:Uncharacterised protein [Yersinia pseudotuberculosis]|nr:Uncharacterised protein [Yersinia pseudotuberculosis]